MEHPVQGGHESRIPEQGMVLFSNGLILDTEDCPFQLTSGTYCYLLWMMIGLWWNLHTSIRRRYIRLF